jgi:phosphopantothenoylcysteine decarboxylase/phosphopantothenate--cysteine ligase
VRRRAPGSRTGAPARERGPGARAAPIGAERARRHVVVTAGPTREPIDPVRYLSNVSSGRMGFAIAAAAAARGHRVTLIAGPVRLETPRGVERIDVESAREMLAAVAKAFRGADALYMAAAVADWRPKRRLASKWRKKDGGAETAALELVRNPDVLATVARAKGERLVVGFALETGDGPRRARRKLVAKNADFIVLNDDSALNSERTTVTILARDGTARHLRDRGKDEVAEALIDLLERDRALAGRPQPEPGQQRARESAWRGTR